VVQGPRARIRRGTPLHAQLTVAELGASGVAPALGAQDLVEAHGQLPLGGGARVEGAIRGGRVDEGALGVQLRLQGDLRVRQMRRQYKLLVSVQAC
jgi:hypothetical protein